MDFVRKGLLLVALGAIAALGTGCSEKEGDSTTYNDYTSQTKIALLANTTYVPYDSSSGDNEGSNVDAVLNSMGRQTLTFFAIDADTVARAIQDKDAIVIPELENGDLDAAISDESRSLIGLFVATGGTLVVFGSGNDTARTDTVDFLNNTFGFSLAPVSKSGGDEPYTRTNTSGTPFSGSPGTLPYLSAVSAIDVTSLPVDGQAVYTDATAGDAIVAVIPFENGRIVFLGWDWFQAEPIGSVADGGWNNVLDKAVTW